MAAMCLVLAAAFACPGTAAAATPKAARLPASRPAAVAAPTHPLAHGAGDRALWESLSAEVAAGYDSARGGFVSRDGAPHEAAIEWALARGRDGDALAMARALRTLHWTRQLLDTIGGGYVTRLRDMDPRSTSFEKRTLPNARRLELVTLAHAATGDASWAHDRRFVEDYFERVLMDPRGGFYSGQVAMADLEPEANGFALQAWWRTAAQRGDPRQRDFARRTAGRLHEIATHPDLGMVRRDRLGKLKEPALLADQVETGRAHLMAWQAAASDSDLATARRLGYEVLRRFEDPRKGGFRLDYATDRFGRARRVSRPFEDNARTARFLVELAAATGDTAFVGAARRAWTAHGRAFERSRLEAAEWALAVRALWAPEPLPRGRFTVPARAATAPAVSTVRSRRR
jgi:uncharacterized protein YyaL (SSP411 family)